MKFKAELTNGQIVALKKDCDCLTHDGPHWLHANLLWKQRNLRILDSDGQLAGLAFAREEAARLRQLEWEFRQRHIARLIPLDAEAERAIGGVEC